MPDLFSPSIGWPEVQNAPPPSDLRGMALSEERSAVSASSSQV